jgi:hypothetical protein
MSDDFATDTYGSTWIGGLNVDQTNCPWTIDSSNNNQLRLDHDLDPNCDNKRYTLGHATATATINQFGCLQMVDSGGLQSSQFGVPLRIDTQTGTGDMYFGYCSEGSNACFWRDADNTSDLGTCTISRTISEITDDQICVYVRGTGTDTEINFWARTGASALTGDPDTWGAPDCCINDAGTTGDLGITCADATGTLSGSDITDDGLFTGTLVRFGSTATTTDFEVLDNFIGGSCVD